MKVLRKNRKNQFYDAEEHKYDEQFRLSKCAYQFLKYLLALKRAFDSSRVNLMVKVSALSSYACLESPSECKDSPVDRLLWQVFPDDFIQINFIQCA